jgi:uncharacterized membrane protein
MAADKISPERLGTFSDGVIAIIITIMVLDVKVPHVATPAALLALWPNFASYALSYLFVGIAWVNHHHLFRFVENADLQVTWANLVFLFFVSLLPFSTAYMAETRMNSFPTALYAAVFLAITIAFSFLRGAIARQFGEDPALAAMDRLANRKDWAALLLYIVAIPAAYIYSALSLALILGVAVMYLYLPQPETKPAKNRT